MSLVFRQHREHMGGFARLIRFFIGNEFDRVFVIITILEVRPFALLVRRPERTATVHDLFAVFVDDRFDVDTAWRGNCEIVSRHALTIGVHISRLEFSFVENVIVGLVLVTVVLFFFLFLFPLLFDEFQRDFLGNRMTGIVRRLHTNLRWVALVIEITFGVSVGDRIASRTDE